MFVSICKDLLVIYKIVVLCFYNFKEWNEVVKRKGCNKMIN